MTTAPLILIFPDNEIVVVPNKSDTIRIHRVAEKLDTILKGIMMHDEEKLDTEVDTVEHNTIHSAKDTVTDVLNDIVDPYDMPDAAHEVVIECKRYIKKKRPCPIPGCKRNNQPLNLATHLIKVHKLSKEERMYWLKYKKVQE